MKTYPRSHSERETRCSTRQEEREIDRYIKMHGV